MPTDASETGALECLDDVAKALGYADSTSYNNICVKNPADVEERLKAWAPKKKRRSA